MGGRISSLVLWPSKSSFHTVVAPSSCGVRGSQCGRPSVGFDQEPGAIRCSRTRQPVVAGSPLRVPLAAAHPWLRFPWPRPLPTGKAATLRCPCFETQERLAARQPEFFRSVSGNWRGLVADPSLLNRRAGASPGWLVRAQFSAAACARSILQRAPTHGSEAVLGGAG